MKNNVVILVLVNIFQLSSFAADIHQCKGHAVDHATREEYNTTFYINKGQQFILEMEDDTVETPSGYGKKEIILKRDYRDMTVLRYTGKDNGNAYEALVTEADENPVGRDSYNVSIESFRPGNRNSDGVQLLEIEAVCNFVQYVNDN